ncbi:hypothetical protein [Burkholderia multivorans]|uniref:hypothetical protein n=1 Tax=Burkholderia multivorans TaxID=87883 RepID=UPI001C2292FA|nr:hypothetical protein [Burkholderia multivorans]MBU9340662.1 hypothetical protein [Burkholderia multivorans]
MNDQQQIRADALTEAQRKALETAVNVLNINWEHETANELWEAFTAPVSQPAAAPIARVQVCGDEITLSATSDQRAVLMTMHDAPIYAEPPVATSANQTGAEGLDQFERIDVQNHVLRRTLQRVMARLTDLLDEDQFANIESIVKEAGVEPPAMAAAAPADERAAWADEIISELQASFDTEGITEYDSGDALIRLSSAIAAVEEAAKARAQGGDHE